MCSGIKRILLIYLAVNYISAEDSEAEKLFRDLEVVPDILDEPPKELLMVGEWNCDFKEK